jgi:hypothetical protein
MRSQTLSKTKPVRQPGQITFTPQESPQFHRVLHPILAVLPVKTVIARTSAPDSPPQAPALATASHQNATVRPPSADTRLPLSTAKGRTALPVRSSRFTSHQSQVTPLLIYGTAIKNPRIPFVINEYKLLIYGKPRCSRLSFPGTVQRKSDSSTFTVPARRTANPLELAISKCGSSPFSNEKPLPLPPNSEYGLETLGRPHSYRGGSNPFVSKEFSDAR